MLLVSSRVSEMEWCTLLALLCVKLNKEMG